jgi:hypothetical protein
LLFKKLSEEETQNYGISITDVVQYTVLPSAAQGSVMVIDEVRSYESQASQQR